MAKEPNNTIMIEWNGTLFSENIYAFFQHNMVPIFSNSIDDIMLSDNYVIQKRQSGSYEIFEWDEQTAMHLYSGRLFAPKGVELM